MGYSKADRRAVIALAIIACCIIAGIVLFGQRKQPLVSVPLLPQTFIKALNSPRTYESHQSSGPHRSYKSHHSNRSYSSYSSNQEHSTYDNPKPVHSSKFSELTTIDLNTADTILLQRIPGIGQNIARWIVQRRERLGGFYTVEQILEVRYVEPSMLKWFTVDTTQIRHFRISDMSFAEMSRHPYIGYDKAKAISNFQRLYGPITDMEQLRATTIFTDEELEKLQNYIF
ncbi:MAG: helix-hairpin-helix domain-containing protein [Bacteroidaceae bacterium]|nr:helix-hairpin-helix domain-containing protein [Bacteroidaceae bacterium]